MSNAVFAGDTSGSITIQAPAVAGTNTLTLPAKTGNVAVDGPAFLAYPSTDTTITSATQTVVACNTELFDTASCFNNTGATVGGIPAYSFLPNVAGYYLFTVTCNNEPSTSPTRLILQISKNGVDYRVSDNFVASVTVMSGSILLYMNGTTDYVNMVVYLAATAARYAGTINQTRFSGSLVRGA
jgi:hypothetical protein